MQTSDKPKLRNLFKKLALTLKIFGMTDFFFFLNGGEKTYIQADQSP